MMNVGLAACGGTRLGRGASAGIGVAAGAATSGVTGGNFLGGALLGGAAGALTDKDDINLGDRIWDRDNDND